MDEGREETNEDMFKIKNSERFNEKYGIYYK